MSLSACQDRQQRTAMTASHSQGKVNHHRFAALNTVQIGRRRLVAFRKVAIYAWRRHDQRFVVNVIGGRASIDSGGLTESVDALHDCGLLEVRNCLRPDLHAGLIMARLRLDRSYNQKILDNCSSTDSI